MWRVYEYYSGNFYAEFVENKQVTEYRELSACCMACAKTELMMQTGKPADTRGWHLQGTCGAFMRVSRLSLDMKDAEDQGLTLKEIKF